MNFPKDLSKIKVAVIFGGKSTEHDISIISAIQAMENFDTKKYQIIPIYITKNNEMFYNPNFSNIKTFPVLESELKKSLKINFEKIGEKTFIVSKRKKYEIDVAFPIVHGTNVEDGNLQGFLHSLDLPIVGCNAESSAICMDKWVSRVLLNNIKIPVLQSAKIKLVDYQNNDFRKKVLDKIITKLKFPLVVKPINLGSSIGISKVDDKAELKNAIDNAFLFSSVIVVETAIDPLREINCAVLGSALDPSKIQISVCEEPLTNDKILSFENKYMSKSPVKTSFNKNGSKGMASATREFPAKIPTTISSKIKEYSKKAFIELGCSGVVRIDFLLTSNGEIYLNELNTIPGSLSFYLWDFSYKELLNKLIDICLNDWRINQIHTFTFNSSVLKR